MTSFPATKTRASFIIRGQLPLGRSCTNPLNMHSITSLFFLVLISLTCVSCRPGFVKELPNGSAATLTGTGITCLYLGHNSCVPGAANNQFGLDFKAAGYKWTRALCQKDSDKDGHTNGQELGDPCCVWKKGDTPLRGKRLSHPGDSSEKNNAGKVSCRATPTTTKPPTSRVTKCTFTKNRAPICGVAYTAVRQNAFVRVNVRVDVQFMRFVTRATLTTKKGSRRFIKKYTLVFGTTAKTYRISKNRSAVTNFFPVFLPQMLTPPGKTDCCGPRNKMPFRVEITHCTSNGKNCAVFKITGAAGIVCRNVCAGQGRGRTIVVMNARLRCTRCK